MLDSSTAIPRLDTYVAIVNAYVHEVQMGKHVTILFISQVKLFRAHTRNLIRTHVHSRCGNWTWVKLPFSRPHGNPSGSYGWYRELTRTGEHTFLCSTHTLVAQSHSPTNSRHSCRVVLVNTGPGIKYHPKRCNSVTGRVERLCSLPIPNVPVDRITDAVFWTWVMVPKRLGGL